MAALKDKETVDAWCMSCADESCDFKPTLLQRRAVGDFDVEIDMKYCGVCHTDLHVASHHNPFRMLNSPYPCVPGHELAGIVKSVGPKVKNFKVGEKVGVGCLVGSCLKCGACKRGQENECLRHVQTYGTSVSKSHSPCGHTLGGYTDKMVVHEHFAIKIPDSYPLEAAGPVMCAGVTMYDPLKKYHCTIGTKLAIIGLGGLGQMGIKLGKILGAEVTVFSRSAAKEKIAFGFGADKFVVSKNEDEMKAKEGYFDLILNTIPAYHPYLEYNRLLAKKGKQVLIGLHNGTIASLVTGRLTCGLSKFEGSMIGGIPATQEVINLCAKHNIKPEVKIVHVKELNNIMETLDGNNDDAVRYVLDIANTLNEAAVDQCKNIPPPNLKEHKGGITLWSIVKEFSWQFFCLKWLK